MNCLWAIITSDYVDYQKKQKTYKSVKHGWWTAVYIAIMGTMYFVFKDSMEFALMFLAGSLIHFSVFPVIYNAYQDLSLFNLSKTSEALVDRFMVWVGLKNTAIVDITALLLSLGILVWCFVKY